MMKGALFVILVSATVPISGTFCQNHSGRDQGERISSFLPVDHWVYVYISLLQDRRSLADLNPSVRPYTRLQVARAVLRADANQIGSIERRWLGLLKEEFAHELSDLEGPDKDYDQVRANLTATTRAHQSGKKTTLSPAIYPELSLKADHVTFAGRGRIDRAMLRDSTYTGRQTDIAAARMEDAYGVFSAGHWSLMIGRVSRSWSPFQDNSLILSSNPYSYDQVAFGYQSRHIGVQSVFAELEDNHSANRYFSAHRLDIRLNNGMNFGLTETVVYGGPNEAIRFGYLNPFTVFANTQLNDGLEANQTFAIDVFVPFSTYVVRSQLLIDDFILDGADKPMPNRETSPDRLAYLIGLTANDLLIANTQATLTYKTIDSYTYNVKQRRPWQGYTYRGKGLGAEANDMDEWSLRLAYFSSDHLMVSTDVSWQRLGQRSLSSNDFEDSTMVKLPFPSGIVEKNLTLNLSVRYQSTARSFFSGMIGVRQSHNHRHIADRTRTNLMMQLSASWQITNVGEY